MLKKARESRLPPRVTRRVDHGNDDSNVARARIISNHRLLILPLRLTGFTRWRRDVAPCAREIQSWRMFCCERKNVCERERELAEDD
ncbi:hypothetical protein TSAR_014809 [Trichomalopsis sarcophagae]|uniref:Uncharacterized protein n=1 Tax=Trichomalopsis sarcophagae TaxID=543379 RepID=A0A232FH39_9HYME|nr:hypothetical protein TSAR_014809 [Trichomalopsis sarcophagae]